MRLNDVLCQLSGDVWMNEVWCWLDEEKRCQTHVSIVMESSRKYNITISLKGQGNHHGPTEIASCSPLLKLQSMLHNGGCIQSEGGLRVT